MSADNWAICPSCADARREAETELYTKVANSYGKVSEAEYRELQVEASEFAKTTLKSTLREDYELGVEKDGDFEVSYSCGCDVCGFTFTYNVKMDRDEVEAQSTRGRSALARAAHAVRR